MRAPIRREGRVAEPQLKQIRAGVLDIAYHENGPASGSPVILMHGFPDDPWTWASAASKLAAQGYRTVAPYLRGYGPTRFLDSATPRSGQQAALGQDLRALLDALGIERATLAAYDWGGRAACIVAALWPERVDGLVSITGYNIQDIPHAGEPAPPAEEYGYWYQWHFNTERGRAGLAANRYALCRLLWQLWSPNWRFDETTYARTAASFDNPDFVEIVIHSYRHRFGVVAGDPALQPIERRLAARLPITVPTVVLHGACDGVDAVENSAADVRFFTGPYERRVVPVAGHFLAWEAPDDIVQAVGEVAPAPS
jgi:pimeloyl-ACP methyl ester carboxylesterase